jgi:hypothetical protein
MRIDFFELSGTPNLGGAIPGRHMLGLLLNQVLVHPTEPQPVFLDFQRIDLATASYIRESVFGYKSIMRQRRSTLYPVIANANEFVRDEIKEIAISTNDAIAVCDLSSDGAVSGVEIIGQLDPKQKMTFEAVLQLRVADATTLMEKYGDQEQTKRTTAWNNRLSSLAARGLLREFQNGRAKSYQPLFDEVT